MRKRLKVAAAKNIGRARALLYTLESLPLPMINQWITGVSTEPPSAENQSYFIELIEELLDRDARELDKLGLPIHLIFENNPLAHLKRWFQILQDSAFVAFRRRQKKVSEFSRQVKNLSDYPRYYQRNFHHQTDGYLSDRSAELYEHQVELLFRGLAAPMRRRLLLPMWKKLRKKKRPKILEIACGSGTFTKPLATLFPQAEITGIDLSPNYIRAAKRKLMDHDNVQFLVAAGEELPFRDRHFDAVVSVYLHHELPPKVREKVLAESLRVCKDKGFWGLLDSIQNDDDPMLNDAIAGFPDIFHEPFYTHYINTPLTDTLKKLSPEHRFKEEVHFLSKVLYRP